MKLGLSVSQTPVFCLFRTVSAVARGSQRIAVCGSPPALISGWNISAINAFYHRAAFLASTDLERIIARRENS
jgi:hypothetical protein